MPPRSPSPEDTSAPTTTETTPKAEEVSLSPQPAPTPTSPLFSASRSQDTPTTEDPWSPSPGDVEHGDHDAATPSAPRSTGRGAAARLRELRRTAAAGVETVGGVLHQLLTRDGSLERHQGLWLPDEDDVEAIADPLAGLASRRMPAGAENPDVTDLIRLGLGLVGYWFKQRGKAATIAEVYAREPQPAPDGPDGADDLAWDGATPPPAYVE